MAGSTLRGAVSWGGVVLAMVGAVFAILPHDIHIAVFQRTLGYQLPHTAEIIVGVAITLLGVAVTWLSSQWDA